MLALFLMGYFYNFYTFTESGHRDPKTLPSKTTGNLAIDSYDYDMLIARADLAFDVRTKEAYAQRLAALTMERDQQRTERIIRIRTELAQAKKAAKLEQRHAGAYTESAIIGEMRDGAAGMYDEHENVTDHVGEDVTVTKVGVPLHWSNEGTETEYSLNSFFARPFSIYDAAWNTDTEYDIALKVWHLWSKKPAIRAKLSNYALFRGKLHIKIALSGTPFHYGRLLASYQPYASYNETLRVYDAMLTETSPAPNNSRILYKAYLAQAPGAKTMDIKENMPMEVEIPFISYKQKFRLFNDANTVITNSTDFYDFYEAGELRLNTFNRFKVANSDYSGPISINVYAWCTDVELGTITGTDIDITAESAVIRTEAAEVGEGGGDVSPMYSGEGNFGSRLMQSLEKGGTEYTEPGPVTKIASAVAKAGESLSDVPVIGTFAKATSTIAKSVSRVASLFGWSKPEILDKASFVKNQPFQNGAVLSGHQTEYKISCDPKCELTVDPTIGGVDCDDMAISTLCAKKSYIGSFDWKDSDVAMTDILWRAGISPMMGVFLDDMPGSGSGNVNFYQDSALAFAARPFNYWRGNIKISFEIVCSKFHRGKLLFRYEPNSSQYKLLSTSPAQMNQQNTIILDIQNGQQITFDIDWAHERSWAAVPYNATKKYKNHYTNDCRGDRTPAYIPELDATSWDFFADELNGVLEVRVLNELVQPTSLSDVTVNVYVWSDEITFAFPTERRLPDDRTYTSSSGSTYTTESAVIGTEAVTMQNNEEKIVSNSSNMDGVHLDHMGEKVVSFRSLLKRFTTSCHYKLAPSSAGKKVFNYVGTNIPLAANGMYQGTYIPSENFNDTTLFNYIRWSYMGYRGSFKHRLRLMGDSGPGIHDYCNVRLLCPDSSSDLTELGLRAYATTDMQNIVNSLVNDYSAGPIYSSMTNRLEGGINFHHNSNGGVEFTTPYYSTNLFQFAFCDNPNGYGLDEVGGMQKYYPNKYAAAFTTYSAGELLTITEDVATGEDFTFLRFQGVAPFGNRGGTQG